MRAGVIGVNWGRVHIQGLRLAGITVEAVCARDPASVQRVAAEERVPRATTEPAELEGLDLVVIATPADTHAALLALFPGRRLICEKPLLGARHRPADLPAGLDQVWVNYAFGFLDTARQAAEAVRLTGASETISLASSVHLPGEFSTRDWFLETASHPLSWLVHLLGPLRSRSFRESGDALLLGLESAGGSTVRVSFRMGGEPGITHALQLRGNGASVTFEGRYVPGGVWRFSPVIVNGTPQTDGEWLPEDCWRRANYRSIDAMIRSFHGRLSRTDGLRLGLFDVAKSLQVESVLP